MLIAATHAPLTYFQAIVIGLIQGVTELFPISSLGHSVLIPSLLGWHGLVNSQSAKESFYLAFIVGLHVASALVLLYFYRKDWARIISGFFRSIRNRSVRSRSRSARPGARRATGRSGCGCCGRSRR